MIPGDQKEVKRDGCKKAIAVDDGFDLSRCVCGGSMNPSRMFCVKTKGHHVVTAVLLRSTSGILDKEAL